MFLAFAAVTIGAAILAIEARDLVYGAAALGIAFLGVAGLFFLLDAAYVGWFQIAVYIGAVVVLILFTVMLVGPKKGETPLGLKRVSLLAAMLVSWCAGQRNSLSGTRLVRIRMRSLFVQCFSAEELRRSTRIHVSSDGGCRNRRISAVKDR